MVWTCFTSDGLDSMIICNEERIEVIEYEDISYDRLLSLINNILQPIDLDIICIANDNIFLFMQDHALYNKGDWISKFLTEHSVFIMKWPLQSLDLTLIENLWKKIQRPISQAIY